MPLCGPGHSGSRAAFFLQLHRNRKTDVPEQFSKMQSFCKLVLQSGRISCIIIPARKRKLIAIIEMKHPLWFLGAIFMELFLDVLGESLVDTAKMLPFLFLAYLRSNNRAPPRRAHRKRCWPAAGAGRSARCPAGLCAAVRLLGHCVQLLCVPRHYAGHPDGRVSGHQR